MEELDFNGRVALVTGAGSGLGRAYALWLAARGARVVVNGRRHDDRPWSAEATVRAIESAGGTAIAEDSDLTDPDSGDAMVAAAVSTFGRLDIVIANAGANDKGMVTDQSLDQLRRGMEVNFFGAVQPILAAMPGFVAQDYGRIVLTTSAAALFGQRGHTSYASAKMAQVGFARALAVETGRTGIRVNVISPYARTGMSRHAIPGELESLMAPERVAPVVGWLAHESCTVTGRIFSAGAGRVRRVALVEGPVIEMTGDWPSALAELSSFSESRNSGRSALELVPELKES